MELGCTYKDKITGFKGVCTGLCYYISGCNQALLAPKVDKDGKKSDGDWFDFQRCVLIKSKKVTLDNSETPGCDISAPIK